MADFTQIPNDLLEGLVRTELSSYETRALLFIARMTWGQRKESETLVLRQFSNATGIDRRNIHRALGKLESRRLIVVCRDDRKAATYRIHSQQSPSVAAKKNHMKPNGIGEQNQREFNIANQWEINMENRRKNNGVHAGPGMRKLYRCRRFPSFAIGKRVRFNDGSFETEDAELQKIVESNDWYGVHIQRE